MIPEIRKATPSDVTGIAEIYNEAILTTDASFDVEPKTIEEQERWFEEHGSKNPILVAEINGRVVGWASLSQWSNRCAYSNTAEISLYIKDGFRNRGIGKKLMRIILAEGEKVGLHTIITRITSGNIISVNLHKQFGFENVGVMKEVGKKFGKLLDVCIMQKIYKSGE
ncbi:MAG: GNAT family N-acetyltransferase [Chloroflexi bacterium]|nr:GNAT family N-acetyltransferase [Chloroflexota bacterium]